MKTLYFAISGTDHLNSMITVYIKGGFSEPYNTEDVIARANDKGVDFSMFKKISKPKCISESEFTLSTHSHAVNIREYVSWQDENGYYEPRSTK